MCTNTSAHTLAHRNTNKLLGTHMRIRKGDRVKKWERMWVRDRSIENSMRCRRNACNVTVWEYKAHRKIGTGMNLRCLLKDWVEQCGTRALLLHPGASFTHSTPRHVQKLTTNSQFLEPHKAISCQWFPNALWELTLYRLYAWIFH